MRPPPVVQPSAWHTRSGRVMVPSGPVRRSRGSATTAAMATDQDQADEAGPLHTASISQTSTRTNGARGNGANHGQDGMPFGARMAGGSPMGRHSPQVRSPFEAPSHAFSHHRESEQAGTQATGEMVLSVLGPTAAAWSPRLQLSMRPPSSMPGGPTPAHSNKAIKSDCPVNVYAQHNQFDQALALMAQWRSEGSKEVHWVSHRGFMHSVSYHKQPKHALAFLKLLPKEAQSDLRVYNLALSACAECQDLDTASAVMQLAATNSCVADTQLMTTYIKVCKAVGALDKAYATYMDIKRQGLALDVVVVGTLLAAIADTMRTDHALMHRRKEQYLLMERATNLAKDAQDSGQKLNVGCWNSLIVCAGRCGQLKRAVELLEGLQLDGLRADGSTFAVLMEACMSNGRPDLAQRMFEQAMREGHVDQVELYTAATTACCVGGQIDWQRALDIYSLLQRHDVTPDAKYYASLITAAGHAGHLSYALEVLSDMVGEGIRPSSAVCSALVAACCRAQQHNVARKVYDLCAAQGVFPGLAQYNRLMDWYGAERRFGDVVSLLTDMTQQARLQPDLNTYRVIINACQRADQAALAFEVFGLMKANRVPILHEKFAHTLYFTLIKSCFNMQRHILAQHNPHPAPWASGSRAGLPVVRLPEARQVLAALGSSLEARGASTLLLQDPDMNTWAQYAMSSYRDMLARGWEPNCDILDKLMCCLRLPCSVRLQYSLLSHSHSHGSSSGAHRPPHLQQPASSHLPPSPTLSHLPGITNDSPTASRSPSSSPDLMHHDSQQAGLSHEQPGPAGDINYQLLMQSFKYQLAFERRAISLVEDAITRGHLPSFTVDQSCTVDLRQLPPSLAEVYTLAVLTAFERRAARSRSRSGAEGGAAGDSNLFYHKFTILVPAFQQGLVMWPSYVPKVLQELKDRDGTGSRQSSGQVQHHYLGLSQRTVPEGEEALDLDDTPFNNQDQEAGDGCGQEQAGASSSTGLAVAATLRRMKLFARVAPDQGVITLEPHEISSWVRAKRTWEMRLSGALNLEGAPQGATSLAQQLARQHPSGAAQHSGAVAASVHRPGQFPGPGSRPRLSNPAEQQRHIRLGLNPDDLTPASLGPGPVSRTAAEELQHTRAAMP